MPHPRTYKHTLLLELWATTHKSLPWPLVPGVRGRPDHGDLNVGRMRHRRPSLELQDPSLFLDTGLPLTVSSSGGCTAQRSRGRDVTDPR